MVGEGMLAGWRPVFRKRGQDGSAKCDAVRTGRSGDYLWVAAYALSPIDRARLDEVEGLGQGYRVETIRTMVQGVILEGFLYAAEPVAVHEGLAPFAWYRAMVVAGAAFHGFPTVYVEGLRAVVAVPDPDVRRAAEQWHIVAEMALSPRSPSEGRCPTAVRR